MIEADCLEVAQTLSAAGLSVATLNTASGRNPGGGVSRGAGAQEERWLGSLAAAKQQALAARKPVLCVLLKSGARNSKRLERSLDKSKKITALLDSFVCVKLDWSKSRALRDRYSPQVNNRL